MEERDRRPINISYNDFEKILDNFYAKIFYNYGTVRQTPTHSPKHHIPQLVLQLSGAGGRVTAAV
jgi:hypothetical protein